MITPSKILIIDDEHSIRNTLKLSLRSHSYDIAEADTGTAGLKMAMEFHPNLIILDLGLPDISGFDCIVELRKWTIVPIIVLTANDDELSKVKLLDAGANDYITKPFGTIELLARIRVCFRTQDSVEATPLFKSENLEIDLSKHKVLVSGKEVKLTNTEFKLLTSLVRESGKVVSQKNLLKQVWGISSEDQNHYLRIYIKELRKKIEINPSNPVHIITEPGVGYRLV